MVYCPVDYLYTLYKTVSHNVAAVINNNQWISAHVRHFLPCNLFCHGNIELTDLLLALGVTFLHLQREEITKVGYNGKQNVTRTCCVHSLQEYPTLTTFFAGEIISRKRPFLTRKWDADEDVDRKHWVSSFIHNLHECSAAGCFIVT